MRPIKVLIFFVKEEKVASGYKKSAFLYFSQLFSPFKFFLFSAFDFLASGQSKKERTSRMSLKKEANRLYPVNCVDSTFLHS